MPTTVATAACGRARHTNEVIEAITTVSESSPTHLHHELMLSRLVTFDNAWVCVFEKYNRTTDMLISKLTKDEVIIPNASTTPIRKSTRLEKIRRGQERQAGRRSQNNGRQHQPEAGEGRSSIRRHDTGALSPPLPQWPR